MAGAFKFNPQGKGYDTKTAKKLGYTRDAEGHLPTRDYRTGMILKGTKHPTFSKGVMQDFSMGYQLMKEGNRYYTAKTRRDLRSLLKRYGN